LVLTLPRRLSHLLDDLGAGDLSASLHLPEIPALMIRLDRIANRLSISILLAALITNRLSISILLAALIMGLATLVPAFNLTEQVNLATILVITSFAVVSRRFALYRYAGRGRASPGRRPRYASVRLAHRAGGSASGLGAGGAAGGAAPNRGGFGTRAGFRWPASVPVSSSRHHPRPEFHSFPPPVPARQPALPDTADAAFGPAHALTRLSARRTRRLIAVSEHAAAESARLLGVSRERIDVVYHGVDPAFRPLPADEVAAFRQRWGLPEPALGTAGAVPALCGHVRAAQESGALGGGILPRA